MATTIQQSFATLRSNLEITGLQEETVSTRQLAVRKAMENGLAVLDAFLVGSYRRSTMIAPLKSADVDVFIVLDPKYYHSHGPQALLQATKEVLRKTYTQTPDISPNGQAVTIEFQDFRVDVVPGFYRNGEGYLIPDGPRGRWIETDPKKHVELWSARNKAHNGDLVPMIKILKGWNKSAKALRSFHLEVMALSVFNGIRIDDFPSGARFFFDKARDKVRVQLADPAGYNPDVASHVTSQAQYDAIGGALDTAYRMALKAEQCATNGHYRTAIDEWRKIFPDYFPAYG
jgi:Second Messenger Oligonucleotide or Dinucleotide Synthetase domain